MLINVFRDVLNPSKASDYLATKSGAGFEEMIERALKSEGFVKLLKDDLNKEWRRQLKKTDCAYVPDMRHFMSEKEVGFFNNTYIIKPHGSQDYPDMYVFYKNKVLSVEYKFSQKCVKPVWNSNVPKQYGIYLFGSYTNSEIISFLGKDVLTQEMYEKLHSFADLLKRMEKEFNEALSLRNDNPFGFSYYSRKAFGQIKFNDNTIVDFLKNPLKQKFNQNVLEFIQTLENN